MSGEQSHQTPETEVIACPACRHLLRVPLGWLGTQVQCPECKALFRAPARGADGKLTEPQLITAPAPAAPARKRFDAMLLLPAFGLTLCGVVGVLVNGVLLYLLLSDPAWGKSWAKAQIETVKKFGGAAPEEPPEQKAARDEQEADRLARQFRFILPLALAASAVVLAGGLSIALRWNYRLAQVACVIASVNIAHGCCVPGAAFGLWGLLMLGSEEGREHFLR